MAKRLVAKTGVYTNAQNEQKGEYTKIGVILDNQNGEYMLLDPTVSLAGVLAKQNVLALNEGKQQRDSVMVSIFTDEQSQQQQPQQQSYGQAPQQPAYQQAPQQPGQQQAQQQPGGFNQNQPPF